MGGPDEWTELDRAKALAWQTRERQKCGTCGTVPSEWKARDWNLDPIVDRDGDQFLDTELPYVIRKDRCPCCQAIGHLSDQCKDDGPGRTFRFVPNPAASLHDPPDDGPSVT